MIDSETRRFIKEEISKQVNIILSSSAGTSTAQTEDIQSLYPSMPTITKRPIMHPYGYVSRAKVGTIGVVARQGEHPGNRITLGHRDKDRPENLEEGETAVYSFGKFTVRFRNNQMEMGKGDTWEPMPMGDTLRDMLKELINFIMAHTHLGNNGFPTGAPLNNSDFASLKANTLDNDKILCKDGGRF